MSAPSLSQAHIHTVLGAFQKLQASNELKQAEKDALRDVSLLLSAHLADAPNESHRRSSSCASTFSSAVIGHDHQLVEAFQEVYRPTSAVRRDMVLRKHSFALQRSESLEQLVSRCRASSEWREPDPGIALLLSKIHSFDEFDVFELYRLSGGRALQLTALYLLQQLDLVDGLKLPLDKLRSFLQVIERGYHPNPYHCSLHAADVVQTVAAVLLADGFKQRLTQLELLALVLAAVMHDVGHPGVSNEFLIRTRAEPAITYNDVSVNENQHLALGFRALLQPQNNFLTQLSADDWAFVRGLIIDIVLATDMKAHYHLLSSLEADLQLFGPDLSAWGSRARTHLLSLIMHCADIGNAIKPRPQAAEWARRVNREFWLEGEQQRAHGLEVGALNDEAAAQVPRSQAVFLKLYAKPCFDLLVRFAPVSGSFAAARLAANQAWWEELAAAGHTRVPDHVANEPPPPGGSGGSGADAGGSDGSGGSCGAGGGDVGGGFTRS